MLNVFICRRGKLEGPLTFLKPEEGCGNNRSVMPLDVPGCTRATMIVAVSILPSSCAQSCSYHYKCRCKFLIRLFYALH